MVNICCYCLQLAGSGFTNSNWWEPPNIICETMVEDHIADHLKSFPYVRDIITTWCKTPWNRSYCPDFITPCVKNPKNSLVSWVNILYPQRFLANTMPESTVQKGEDIPISILWQQPHPKAYHSCLHPDQFIECAEIMAWTYSGNLEVHAV